MPGVRQPQQWIVWIEKATVFHGLDQALLSSIADQANLRSLEDGEFFFMQGDPALRSYLLIEGQVRLSQVNQDGQQVMLGYIGPGREFGIIAGLQAANYPVSAQAVERSRALYWDHKVFERLFNEIPMMQRNAMQIMARQIGEFQTRIRELSTQRVERRIARALLRLMHHSSRKTEEGIVIDLPLTRQDLAELAGTTLFTVSRTLKQWENQGLIRSKREQVIICDLDGLLNLTEDSLEAE